MRNLQHRGRCRLMLRMPDRRADLSNAVHPDFMELCAAYELACEAILTFSAREEPDRVREFRDLADCLETEALALAIQRR